RDARLDPPRGRVRQQPSGAIAATSSDLTLEAGDSEKVLQDSDPVMRSTIVFASPSVKQTCPVPSSVSLCELSCPRACPPGRITKIGVRGSLARTRRQM